MAVTLGATLSTTVLPVVSLSQNAISHTGTVNETTKATATIPANLLGNNGHIMIWLFAETTNNGNAKTVRYKFGGTTLFTVAHASQTENRQVVTIVNNGATNAQHCFNGSGFGGNTNAVQTSAIDTTAPADVTVTCELANSGDTITIHVLVLTFPG